MVFADFLKDQVLISRGNISFRAVSVTSVAHSGAQLGVRVRTKLNYCVRQRCALDGGWGEET